MWMVRTFCTKVWSVRVWKCVCLCWARTNILKKSKYRNNEFRKKVCVVEMISLWMHIEFGKKCAMLLCVFSAIVLLYNCQFVFPPWPLSFRICMCLRSDSRIYILLKRMSLINFESTANILIKSNIKYTRLHIKWIQTRSMIKK